LITGLNLALTNILEKKKGMGKVRPDYIKKLARKLVERFPKRFNSDFENNKKMVAALTDVTSTKIRNRVAGYVTRLATTSPDQNSVENDYGRRNRI
jgi:small subunit ribosomal protein S17e